MTITATQEKEIHRNVRISVLAAMETGNFDRARTILKEYRAEFKTHAASLAADVAESYNIVL